MTDCYGLALATDGVEVSDYFVEAIDRLLALCSGTQPLLEALLAVDNEFELACRCSAGNFAPPAVFAHFSGLHDGR